MSDVDLAYATVEELAPRIAAGEISPVALTRAQLARIGRLDGELKSYRTLTAEAALAEAEAAEAAIGRGEYRGPLHGIPVAVKDLCFTAGVVTAGGTTVRRDFIPDEDATVVRRLRQAGAVLLGKLTLTEGAMGGYHPHLDIPLNPWNAERWSGASSSGSGVATAAGLCYASLGSDTGGSIRFPAAANGTVGLKPTWGRVSRFGVWALAESLDHVGPLTRSTFDAAAALQAIAGPDRQDPTTLPDPVPDYLAGLDAGVRGLRLGIDREWARRDVQPEVTAAVEGAAEVLAGQGAEIVEVSLPEMREALEHWPLLCASEAALAHAETYPSRAGEYGAWYRAWLERGHRATAVEYARGHVARLELSARLHDAFASIEALICPAMPFTAFPVTREMLVEAPARFGMSRLRFTAPFDLNGAPTLTLPAGLSSEGLPLSVQFAGKALNEESLCRIGRAYEVATDFRPLRPPLDG